MNYRNLYKLVSDSIIELNERTSEIGAIERTYANDAKSLQESIDTLNNTLLEKLSKDLDPEAFIQKIKSITGAELERAGSHLKHHLDSIRRLEIGLLTPDKVDDIVGEIKSNEEAYKNAGIDWSQKEKTLIYSSDLIDVIENYQESEIENGLKYGKIRRFFSSTKNAQYKASTVYQSLITKEDNKWLTDLSDFESMREAVKEMRCEVSNLAQIQEALSEKNGELKSSLFEHDRLKGEIERLNWIDIYTETKNLILAELSSDMLFKLYESQGKLAEHKELSKHFNRLSVVSSIMLGLRNERVTIETTSTKLKRTTHKLRRAKQNSGDRAVKNFNDEKFKLQISELCTRALESAKWASSARTNILSSPSYYGNDFAFYYILFHLINSEASADYSNGAQYLLRDHLAAISDIMPSIEEDVATMAEGISDIDLEDVDRISIDSLSQIGSLADISIPDISDAIPNVSIPDVYIPETSSPYSGSSNSFSDSGSSNSFSDSGSSNSFSDSGSSNSFSDSGSSFSGSDSGGF